MGVGYRTYCRDALNLIAACFPASSWAWAVAIALPTMAHRMTHAPAASHLFENVQMELAAWVNLASTFERPTADRADFA